MTSTIWTTSNLYMCGSDCAAVLDVGVTLEGQISIDVAPGETFEFSDVDANAFGMLLRNFGVPEEPYIVSNWTTANPIPLNRNTAVLRESGGGLTTGGDYNSGILLFELSGLFVGADPWMIMDLGSGEIKICVFFQTAGCISGATLVAVFSGEFFPDADSDYAPDFADTCLFVPFEFRDTDVDGFGNICDPDLNNDCVVNATDLGLFRAVFFSDDPDADFNGDGVVNTLDLGILKAAFFGAPGPSLAPNVCAPVTVALENFGDGAAPSDGGWNDGTGGAVADAGEDGIGDHALLYVATPPQAGFHVIHPAGGATPNPEFLGNFNINDATDVIFRARHSGVGDPVVLRVVLFQSISIDGVNWAQTTAAVTISNTATQWQTYSLSIRPMDLVTGGVDGLSLPNIRGSVVKISLRHDPLGTGPLTYSPVSQETGVYFDDIELSAQGGAFF